MANTYLTRTQGTPTNSKKWTISFWMKGKLTNGNFYAIFGCDFDGGDSYFGVGSGGQGRNEIGLLEYHTTGTNYGQGYTDASLRDSSGWYHIVFAYDSTQATASDRGKTYINGVFNNSTYSNNIPLNHDSKFNTSGVGIRIGNRSQGGGSANYDGCLSHFHFIDGTAYDATPFGSTDSTTGEWKINTSPSVTYGNNGFFILKDGNSVTDQSGNGNNFTVGGGTLTNTEDCPSNVFCTLNPLISNAGGVISQGANTGYNSASVHNSVVGTLGAITGKYYFEVDADTIGSAINATAIGIASEESTVFQDTSHNAGDLEDYVYTAGAEYQGNGATVSYGNSYSAGDIIGVAMDLDNGKLYFSKNGTWQNSGDPTSGATGTGAKDIPTGKYYVPMLGLYGGTLLKANFGNGTFGANSVASAGTNASGNGIFEYDVPTGYTALSTKGLNL